MLNLVSWQPQAYALMCHQLNVEDEVSRFSKTKEPHHQEWLS